MRLDQRVLVEGTLLLVDAANVVGSRPTGWWKDRAGAARGLVERLRAARAAGRLEPLVIAVLEGAARSGASEGSVEGVEVVHAAGSGDERLLELATSSATPVVLVSADRDLCRRVAEVGGTGVRPGWLLDRLDGA
ncbi:MAG: NTP pyrophosphohydrolase [Acidimicrobiales bacterium]